MEPALEYPVLKLDQELCDFMSWFSPDELLAPAHNPVAAMLLAMCDALCTLEGPEPVQLETGFWPKTGMNLLISDPFVDSLVQSMVVRPIRNLQARILRETSAINQDERESKELIRKAKIINHDKIRRGLGQEKDEFEDEKLSAPPSEVFKDETTDLVFGTGRFPPENAMRLKRYGNRCARVFASGTTFKTLVSQTPDAHLGHLLVHCPLSRVEEASDIDQLVNQLMTGSFQVLDATGSTVPSSVTGNFIATVSPAILQALANPNLCSATWPNRMFWVSSKGRSKFHDNASVRHRGVGIAKAFELAAMRCIKARRACHEDTLSPTEGLQQSHFDFVSQLSRLPGGSRRFAAVATPVFVTLSRGIQLLVKATGNQAPEFINNRTIMTLALYIAGCSAVFERKQRRQQVDQMNRDLMVRLFSKVAQEEGTTRDLVRRFNHITTAKCEASLECLKSLQLVDCQSGVWRAIEALPDAKKAISSSTPVIDV